MALSDKEVNDLVDLKSFFNYLNRMKKQLANKSVAVQYSAGYDSSFLIALLNKKGINVVPLYLSDNSVENVSKNKPVVEKFLIQQNLYNKSVDLTYPNQLKFMFNDEINFISGWKMGMQIVCMSYCQKEDIPFLLLGYINDNADRVMFDDESTKAINKTTELFNELYGNYGTVSVHEPMRALNKSVLAYIGTLIDMPSEYTTTCGDYLLYGNMQCGRCILCQKRKYAFQKARVEDKIPYMFPSPVSDEEYIALGRKSYAFLSDDFKTAIKELVKQEILEC